MAKSTRDRAETPPSDQQAQIPPQFAVQMVYHLERWEDLVWDVNAFAEGANRLITAAEVLAGLESDEVVDSYVVESGAEVLIRAAVVMRMCLEEVDNDEWRKELVVPLEVAKEVRQTIQRLREDAEVAEWLRTH